MDPIDEKKNKRIGHQEISGTELLSLQWLTTLLGLKRKKFKPSHSAELSVKLLGHSNLEGDVDVSGTRARGQGRSSRPRPWGDPRRQLLPPDLESAGKVATHDRGHHQVRVGNLRRTCEGREVVRPLLHRHVNLAIFQVLGQRLPDEIINNMLQDKEGGAGGGRNRSSRD